MAYTGFENDRRAKSTSALLALSLHAILLSLFIGTVESNISPPGPVGATLSVIAFGKDPAAGKPDAKQQREMAAQKERKAKKINADTAEETVEEPKPSPSPPKVMMTATASDTVPPPSSAQNAQNATDTTTTEQSPLLAGAGSVALGVKATGTAGSPDSALAGAISSAIANQMRACWNPPVNSKTVATLNHDRRVIVASFAKNGSIQGNPSVFLIHADQKSEVAVAGELETAAIDALRRCSPITLPAPLYPYWQQVTFEFFPGVEQGHVSAK